MLRPLLPDISADRYLVSHLPMPYTPEQKKKMQYGAAAVLAVVLVYYYIKHKNAAKTDFTTHATAHRRAADPSKPHPSPPGERSHFMGAQYEWGTEGGTADAYSDTFPFGSYAGNGQDGYPIYR